jgi:cellulose synthase/poly-beta-1,6-N-acetylglucosamine synthase-like glycosyltransferase
MGALAVGFAVLAVVLFVVAVIFDRRGAPPTQLPSLVPLNVQVDVPQMKLAMSAAFLGAAVVTGIAALQAAAAMQVLARHQGRARDDVLPASESGREIEELPAGTALRCTVLIPAHNEEAVIGATLDSLGAQRRRPDRVRVIADNCTDGTVELVRARGVEVVETVGNAEKKAGALNQVLALLLPDSELHDVILVMDADSTISEDFLEVALGRLEADPGLMAVGGLFYGEDGGGLIGQLQRNEFTRYQRIVARKNDRVFVLTGTAAVMRVHALQAVAEARGEFIPGPEGRVYDTLALTEDNELTLALKTLGAKLSSPPQCRVTTEVMTHWRDLWRQRLRWHRGALENIGLYGLTRATAMYWGQQLGLAYGVLALWSYLALMTITLLAADEIRWAPFWVVVGLIFVVERLVTVWAIGWPGRSVAAPIAIELAYAMFLQICFVTSIVQIVTGREAGWNYVPRPAVHSIVLIGVAPYVTAMGILLPASILYTDWYAGLSLWVGFNTLVFAVISLFQILPPLRRRHLPV